VVHLDPHPTEGYLRAVTGDLGFTFDEWWDGGAASDDTTPPTVTDLTAGPDGGATPAGNDLPVFTPNGDALTDTLTVQHTLSEPAYLDVSIAKTDDTVVRAFTSYSEEGVTSDVWDGKNNAGSFVGDGVYRITVTPKDRAGNIGEAATTSALVLTALRAQTVSPVIINSSDGDLLAQTQTQSVTLDQPATLTWVIRNAAGVVRTVMADEFHDVGPVSFVWDGLDDLGGNVADGVYSMTITAVTGKGTYSQSVNVRVGPFKVTGKTSGAAGQKIKLTIVTAEPQTGWPTFYVKQPGLTKYRVSLIKYSSTKFTATFTLKAGAPGNVKITITGTDTGGGIDARNFAFTLL
jgi:flagellar hook assembly protein FlgD